MSFGHWLTILFIVLQLTGVTDFSWWWIIVPLLLAYEPKS